MASAEKVFAVLEPAAKVWAVFADFPRWNDLLIVEEAASRGWGDRFLPKTPPALGTWLEMRHGDRPVQIWQIDQWTPGQSMGLASRRWLGRATGEMQSRLTVELRPTSAVETALRIRLESRFTHFFFGPLLTLAFPLKRELAAALNRLEDGVVARFSRG